MEIMLISVEFWRSKRVLLTGHTGFKGGWLSLWLQSMGVNLHGLSLEPSTNPNLFTVSNISSGMNSTIGDIRDYETVRKVISEFKPDIVIHMAAQPLVRRSYDDPIETYSTNVMGVVHVLEAVRQISSVRVVLNVTTDKCYENKEWVWGYRENEPMGGFDPYSSSKGCSELITSAYKRSYFDKTGVGLASARAGNVIGGGDWSTDRLVPDILRSFETGKPVVIRNPDSTRPWQHVLEPLSGYLKLVEKLWDNPKRFSEGWNFGPLDTDVHSVSSVIGSLAKKWGSDAVWEVNKNITPHEAHLLKLDISKAERYLDWVPRWTLTIALEKVVEWHQGWLEGRFPRSLCEDQISQFINFEKEKYLK